MGRVATSSVCCSHVAMQATLSAEAVIVATPWKNRDVKGSSGRSVSRMMRVLRAGKGGCRDLVLMVMEV